MGERRFFDFEDRLQSLSREGEPLENVAEAIPWEAFRPRLAKVHENERKFDAGRNPAEENAILCKASTPRSVWLRSRSEPRAHQSGGRRCLVRGTADSEGVPYMRVFNFSPSAFAAEYRCRGYVHIKGGVDPEFFTFAKEQAERLVQDRRSLKDWEFKGKKEQFLFSFPPDADYPDGVHQSIAAVTGLAKQRLTLCERHLKVYDHAAAPDPAPHKDRVASEVAVGIPLSVPPRSVVILYPTTQVVTNPHSTTEQLRRSLDAEQVPEKVLKKADAVEVDVQPGDLIMFRGSAIWHERLNPAGASVLYLKFNSLRLDPLGEDPTTPTQRERTLRVLPSLSDEQLLTTRIEVSPRLTHISRHYTRFYWKEVIQAYIEGEKEFNLNEQELQFFRHVDSGKTIGWTLHRLGVSESDPGFWPASIRRLMALGGIDIVS